MTLKRIIAFALLAALLLATPALARRYHDCHGSMEIDFEGSTLVVQHDSHSRHCRHDDAVIEITRDLDLYVDGDRISTSRSERELLEEYYLIAKKVVRRADELEEIGEQMEIDGELLEKRIEAGVLRHLAAVFSDRDHRRHGRHDRHDDEWEEDLEELTDWAAEISREAEGLSESIEDMQDIMDDLQDTIPELDDLDWL